MLKALVVNDDGYRNAGIRAVLAELTKYYDVVAVAPANEQSWIAKSITRHRELTIVEAKHMEFDGYVVDGTPADCVQLGLYQVCKELPDFVVSGINVGSNVGYEEILSSGTVGAALEASLQGIPAFAASIDYSASLNLTIDFSSQEATEYFKNAAVITRNIIEKVMSVGFPSNVHVVSINMPWGVKVDTEWVITRPHISRHEQLFAQNGEKYKHQGNVALREAAAEDSDLAALEKGFVSILPLNIQLTSRSNQTDLADILGKPIFG